HCPAIYSSCDSKSASASRVFAERGRTRTFKPRINTNRHEVLDWQWRTPAQRATDRTDDTDRVAHARSRAAMTFENSPAFQRWVDGFQYVESRQGRQNVLTRLPFVFSQT